MMFTLVLESSSVTISIVDAEEGGQHGTQKEKGRLDWGKLGFWRLWNMAEFLCGMIREMMQTRLSGAGLYCRLTILTHNVIILP
jgi:hypothetical protein